MTIAACFARDSATELWFDAAPTHQGPAPVDTNKLPAHIRGGILKAGEGIGYLVKGDRREWVKKSARALRNSRRMVQYYHYARPDTGSDDWLGDAVAEAESFRDELTHLPVPDNRTFIDGSSAAVWLDLEHAVPQLDKSKGAAWVLRWLEVVEQFYPAGLYTSAKWLESEAWPSDQEMLKILWRPDGSRRPFWVARYGPNDGQPHLRQYPHEEKCPDMLLETGAIAIKQYTSNASIAGVDSPPHDLNLVYLRK